MTSTPPRAPAKRWRRSPPTLPHRGHRHPYAGHGRPGPARTGTQPESRHAGRHDHRARRHGQRRRMPAPRRGGLHRQAVNDDLLEHSLKRAAEQYSLREQIRRHTEHLEELVASRTRELLEAHRVAVVGETVACMAHTIKNLAAALEGSLFVLKQGMESGNREYLDDGWAMLEEDISRVRDQALAPAAYRAADGTARMPCGPGAARPPCGQASGRPGRQSEHSAPVSGCRRFRPHPSGCRTPRRLPAQSGGQRAGGLPRAGAARRPAEVRVEIAPHARRPHLRRAGQRHGVERGSRRTAPGRFVYDQKRWYRVRTARNAQSAFGNGRPAPVGEPADSGALFRIVLPLRVERTPAAAEANHLREDS